MAWTDPRTWTDGELVTASIMNIHVRDDLLALGPIQRKYKTADQSVTSSTTFVDDTHLQFAVAANETWCGQINLLYVGGTAGDLKTAMNAPASTIGYWSSLGAEVATITNVFTGTSTSSVWADTNTSGAGALGATAPALMIISFAAIVAGTAGTLKLRWAQNTSSGTATTLLAGSYLLAWKMN